jgi:hypothetical protein
MMTTIKKHVGTISEIYISFSDIDESSDIEEHPLSLIMMQEKTRFI